MSIQKIPPRPHPADYASDAFLSWLDNFKNIVSQLINGVGTSTNDNAAAGSIGELVESQVLSGAAISISNNTPTDVTSISLTAGDWDVWGTVALVAAAGTLPTNMAGWINTTSATFPTRPGTGQLFDMSLTYPAGTKTQTFPVGQMRLSLASTTTVYLSAYTLFTVSTMTVYGYIAARRRR